MLAALWIGSVAGLACAAVLVARRFAPAAAARRPSPSRRSPSCRSSCRTRSRCCSGTSTRSSRSRTGSCSSRAVATFGTNERRDAAAGGDRPLARDRHEDRAGRARRLVPRAMASGHGRSWGDRRRPGCVVGHRLGCHRHRDRRRAQPARRRPAALARLRGRRRECQCRGAPGSTQRRPGRADRHGRRRRRAARPDPPDPDLDRRCRRDAGFRGVRPRPSPRRCDRGRCVARDPADHLVPLSGRPDSVRHRRRREVGGNARPPDAPGSSSPPRSSSRRSRSPGCRVCISQSRSSWQASPRARRRMV